MTLQNSFDKDDGLGLAELVRKKEGSANEILDVVIARAEEPKQRYLERMAREFGVDGVVFHDSRTCPNNSNARYGLPQRLRRAAGLPVLVLDGDLNDLRCFSDEQARTNIEAFAEQLEGAGARAARAARAEDA